jgi:hypothetical protein
LSHNNFILDNFEKIFHNTTMLLLRQITVGILLTFFFIVIGIALSSHKVSASCIEQTVAEQKARADVIVLGNVIRVTDNGYEVAVEQYYKGTGGTTLKVAGGDPSIITSVDLPLDVGKHYLLFLRDEYGTFQTDACSGSREVTDVLTDEEVAELGDGSMPAVEQITPSPVKVQSARTSQLHPAVLLGSIAAVIAVLFHLMRKTGKAKR